MRTEYLKDKSLYAKGKNKKGILILHGFTGNKEDSDILFKYFKRKNFTVARPILPGHVNIHRDITKFGPSDWLQEAKEWLDYMSKDLEQVFVIGISFGSNLAMSLCADDNCKAKGVVTMEMPVFFNFRISLLLHILQPILEFFGVDFVKKDSIFYRKEYKKKKSSFPILPIVVLGKIRVFIKKKTKSALRNIKNPCLIIQSEASDLINKYSAQYAYNAIPIDKKEIYYVSGNNHDLNLLDEPEKILMIEKIYNFISKI